VLKKGLHEKSSMTDLMIHNKKCNFSIVHKSGVSGVTKQRDPNEIILDASGDTELSDAMERSDDFNYIDDQEKDTHKKYKNLSHGCIGCHQEIKMPFAGRHKKSNPFEISGKRN
jgi:hypothetical protein